MHTPCAKTTSATAARQRAETPQIVGIKIAAVGALFCDAPRNMLARQLCCGLIGRGESHCTRKGREGRSEDTPSHSRPLGRVARAFARAAPSVANPCADTTACRQALRGNSDEGLRRRKRRCSKAHRRHQRRNMSSPTFLPSAAPSRRRMLASSGGLRNSGCAAEI